MSFLLCVKPDTLVLQSREKKDKIPNSKNNEETYSVVSFMCKTLYYMLKENQRCLENSSLPIQKGYNLDGGYTCLYQ